MSLYVKCPSCGRILGDKEIIYEEGIKKINSEILTDEERQKKISELINSLEIPQNCYCCKTRLMTYVDTYYIVK